MKFKKLVCIAVVLSMVVWTFAACGEKEEAKEDTFQTKITSDYSFAGDVQDYLDNVDSKYAYGIAKTLAYDEKYFDNELGWRTAGSDAEHACADYLMEEMENLGLEDVEKVGVPCDKFQFNDSKLTVEGTKIDLIPASYQQTGTGEDGITAEIVDCKTGFEADYEGKDVDGKIVLVKVDQSNESWIDGYIRQANEKGAAAVVSYADSGYGELNKDTINVQDVCCDDLLPTAAISANQAKKIKKAIKNGNNEATLMIDAAVEKGVGTTYNVVGKIKGKDSDQQTIISAHYDKYWFGFQDDSIAIGNVLAMAKALKDSGYEPENDLVFVCHGAEEWGLSNAQDDWTTGAWGMVTRGKPEWPAKTKCMFNFELNAIDDGSDKVFAVTVPELSNFVKTFVDDSGLVVRSGHIKRIKAKTTDSNTMEDGVSYRWAGVPYMVNGFQGGDFSATTYHTQFDAKDTWDKDVFVSNANFYGAMLVYTDKMPAMELDLRATCDDLEEALNEDTAKEADADIEGYKAELTDLREACEVLYDKMQQVNVNYEKLVAEEDEEGIKECREEGAELNAQVREVYKQIQKELIATDTWGLGIGHSLVDNNIGILQGVMDGLDKEKTWTKKENGALDMAWQLNGGMDYNYYLFSKEVAGQTLIQYDDTKWTGKRQFFTDKLPPVYWVGDTTYDLVRKDAAGEKIDYKAAKEVYKAALDEALVDLKAEISKEVSSMRSLADKINDID